MISPTILVCIYKLQSLECKCLCFVSCFAIKQVSNKFYFTFSVHPEAMISGLKIRNVVPATEEEARRVLERMDAEGS